MMTYLNPWLLDNKPIDSDDIKGYEGFVYLITDTRDGRMYVGKKTFKSRRMQKKTGRRKTLESDWKSYYGSHKPLLEGLDKDTKMFYRREILHLCKYKKQMTYLELKEQFIRDVLFDPMYLNDNIAGKYFSTEAHIYKQG